MVDTAVKAHLDLHVVIEWTRPLIEKVLLARGSHSRQARRAVGAWLVLETRTKDVLERAGPRIARRHVRLDAEHPIARRHDRGRFVLRRCLRSVGRLVHHEALLDPRRDDDGRHTNAESIEGKAVLAHDAIGRWYAMLRRWDVVVEAAVLVVRDDERHRVPEGRVPQRHVHLRNQALALAHRRVGMLPRRHAVGARHAWLQERELRQRAVGDVAKELLELKDLQRVGRVLHVLVVHDGPRIVLIVGAPRHAVLAQEVKVALLRPQRAVEVGHHAVRRARHDEASVGVRLSSHRAHTHMHTPHTWPFPRSQYTDRVRRARE